MNNNAGHRFVLDNVPYVNQICTPLFEKLKINYFSYGRFYDDQSFQVLVSNSAWYEHFWRVNHKMSTPKLSDFSKKESAVYLWEDSLQSDLVKDAKELFHMDNGLTIMRRVPRYFEYFSFAFSKSEKSSVSGYLNNLKILESFGDYFIEKASTIIQAGQNKKIHLSVEAPTYIDIPNLSFSELDLFDAPKSGNSNNDTLGNINFNAREIDCVTLLKKGFTVKKMSGALSLSPRTVEDYIVTIRQKLGCQKKSDIIAALEKR